MGHINHDDLTDMVEKTMVTGITLTSEKKEEFCEVCIKAKAARKSFPKEATGPKPKAYGEKVVSDVWGPAAKESLGHNRYYVLFQDRASHEEKVDFMKEKSQTMGKYLDYEAWVNVHRDVLIGIFGCDRGGEFMSKEFTDHLKRRGMVRHLTVHDSPASNGAAERGNRTHLECARAMIFQSGLTAALWAEAVRHSVWLRNRSPTRALDGNITPHEFGTKQKPDLSNLREWGSVCWVKILNAGKLEPHAQQVRFVGFDDEYKGYRVYWEGKNRVSIERDVYFNKNDALMPDIQIEGETSNDFVNSPHPAGQSAPNSTETTTDTQSTDSPKDLTRSHPDSPDIKAETSPKAPKPPVLPPALFPHEAPLRTDSNDAPNAPGRSLRPRAAVPGFYKDTRTYQKRNDVQEAEFANMASLEDWMALDSDEDTLWGEEVEEVIETAQAMAAMSDDEPMSDEALAGSEREQWINAMRDEIDHIESVHTYDIIRRPSEPINIIPSRWVLRRKRDARNNIARWKARWVVKGFRQDTTNYERTFAPVVRPASIRTVLAAAASKKAVIHQADAKNAYLHGHNNTGEVFYMELAPNYLDVHSLPADVANIPIEDLVCVVWRPLYGSKQGACRFYQYLAESLAELGYKYVQVDEAVFYKFSDDGESYKVITASTDDFALVAENDDSMVALKADLSSKLDLVDLGEIHWILGMSVKYDREAGTITLGQEAYIDQLIQKYGLTDARPCDTPLPPGIDLTPGSQHVSDRKLTPSQQSEFRARIGSISYLTEMTRADIRFAVSHLAQNFECAYQTHLDATTRLLRYLKGTKNYQLVLGGPHANLVSYSDADFAQQLHRHSISGYVSFVGIGAVSWSSKKQTLVTVSSTEAEYVGYAGASKYIIWLQNFLKELWALNPSLTTPTTLFGDNQAAIRLCQDSTFHARSKHIDVQFHFVRQAVSRNLVKVTYLSTHDMIADVFTKSLDRFKLSKFRHLLGLHPL